MYKFCETPPSSIKKLSQSGNNTMVDAPGNGNEGFQDAVNTLEDHPDWEFEEDWQTLDEIVEDAETSGRSELKYQHTETDGSLNLTINGFDGEPVLEGHLTQSLDIEFPHDPTAGYFTEELVETYQAIAEDQESDYIDPVGNVYDVLSLHAPHDYERTELEEALTQASDASREVQSMHDEVTEVVRDYRE